MPDPFTHLDVVSSASMRYGTVHPPALVERAAELGMEALALTDRDGVYGAVKHLRACREAGLGAILGVNLAVAAPEGGRVTVLARGRRGWASLCRLVSAAHATGGRGVPAFSRDTLAAHAEGLVVLLGPDSDVGRAVRDRHHERARRLLDRWRAIAEVAVELVDHYGTDQRSQAAALLRLAAETRTLAVLGNAVRYPRPADAEVAHVLDEARRWLPGGTAPGPAVTQAHLKSGTEMLQVAERICGPDPAAARRLIAHTRALAASCVLDPAADLGMDRPHLPRIPDARDRLWRRCTEALRHRGLHRDDRARSRLAHELEIIEHKGFPAYFLTVADITDRIRDRGIRCSIRGSGTGSLVNHLLGISAIDPLAHGLLMERFLTPSRTGLPDIDLDVESARRLDAYQAIFDAYPHAACVSMMETYRARSAIRDVGAAMGIPPHEIDMLAKAFPHIRARQIRSALEDLPELRAGGLDRHPARALFRLAERLDGLPRHIAMHPCGIVVSDPGLRDRTPLEPSQLGYPMTQYDKDDVEQMGLIKLDVIGVRMQSAITHALAEIERTEHRRVAIDTVPLDDPATFAMVRTSRTLGCFQIESPGQRELVSRLRPADLHDLIVDISLFRPGPVNSDMITPFIAIRDGRQRPEYPSPVLRDALAETGGVVIFHEQVLKVLHAMTGCGLDQAEAMRRRLGTEAGKEEVRELFTTMARDCGHPEETVRRVWEVLSSFGAFGFCKAHAAAFALPTYQSAWLKRHHPAAFYAGVLTHGPGMYPRRAIIDDARRFGIAVLGVDVNRSARDWRVEPAGGGAPGIRAGLADVRGITDAEVDAILGGRPYTSLADFVNRARVSRDVVDRLVRVGAFDGLQPADGRAALTRRDLMLQAGALERAGRRGPGGAQLPIGFVERVRTGELPEMTPAEVVRTELEVLGYDAGGHLLDEYADLLAALAAGHGAVPARDLGRVPAGAEVLVAGVKVATQTPAVRSGQRIIFTTLDDATGLVDLTFFESVQDRCAATVFGSWLLAVRGRVRRVGSGLPTINATHAYDLAELARAWREDGSAGLRDALTEEARRGPLAGVGGRRIRYANGYELSGYADITPAGASAPPRRLWHASPGSSGG
ncbi:DNA polymerase III subunit alpha [Marinitenerispora sediminis]|uniref:DNA-directed DNA polymerase n=1 Tax=Marinitenerispora sediminis TaxID=1931232 RepID=A0A368T8I7_9ACTN|nr:DNA polymerase III subunit alpha [Marinitenerispora sediminis]RCV55044.1 DNA polymerase III subunit alpha [Marinitenerispora sediminis]RCV58009.1 DNA polymerase III subunit alpha [Marinitenerispora sediminis]RCV60690.1 DNA polymerase III subunit alpha [Marinitenerispora sediminis]